MILLLVTFFPLTYKIISPFLILTGFGTYTEYITGFLYTIGVLMAFPHIRNSVRINDIIYYLLFAGFFLASQLFYPLSVDFINKNSHDILLYFVPIFFLGIIVNYERDQYLIKSAMRIAFLIALFWEACIIFGLVELESSNGEIGEQMDLAYYILLINSYNLIEYNNSHDKFELCAFLIGSFLLLFMGTRGPVVLEAIFLVVYIFLFHAFKRYNELKKLGIFLLFSVFYMFSTPIVISLSLLASKLGMNAKVFDSLMEGTMVNLEDSSGRDMIYDVMWNAIAQDTSYLGYGFGADRFFSPSGGYAHNFEIELFVEFGYIGGGLILLLLTILSYRAYRRVRGTVTAEFMLVIFFWGFMSLQFSKSWLIHSGFFFMIGYFISILRGAKYC